MSEETVEAKKPTEVQAKKAKQDRRAITSPINGRQNKHGGRPKGSGKPMDVLRAVAFYELGTELEVLARQNGVSTRTIRRRIQEAKRTLFADPAGSSETE